MKVRLIDFQFIEGKKVFLIQFLISMLPPGPRLITLLSSREGDLMSRIGIVTTHFRKHDEDGKATCVGQD